jgi:restriction endonuclease S subunit
MNNIGTILHYEHFNNLTNWSVAGAISQSISYNKEYKLVPIGQFLTRNRNVIDIDDETIYTQVTLKINNGGVVERGKKKGAEIGTKKQIVVRKGQFIFSKIDARNGAFGIIPEELDGAIVTNDFPVFNIDEAIINPTFLLLITTTNAFAKFSQSCSSGTTNRQRIDVDAFLQQRIPLPLLEEQKIIVRNFSDRINEANEKEKEIIKLKNNITTWLCSSLGITINNANCDREKLLFVNYRTLTKWSIDEILKYERYSFKCAKYEVLKISNVIELLEGGKTPSTKRADYWGNDVYWVSAKDMKEDYLHNIKDKLSLKGVVETKMKIYPKGTLLGVFRSGILRHSFPICITDYPVAINQDLKAIIVNESKIQKEYFFYYLNSLQDLVLNTAQKKGVTVESVDTEAFMEIPIVCPPEATQNSIIDHISKEKKQIYSLQKEASKLRLQAITFFEKEMFE